MNRIFFSLFMALLAVLVACQPADAPPATPTGLKATPADKSVKLEWTANTEADLKGYVLSATLSDGALVSNTNIAVPTTQATISDLTNGTVYTFKILAEDKAGTRSAPSAAITATPNVVGTPPAKPSGLTASAQDGQVLLTWTKNAEADLNGYTLYYGTSANSLNQTKALTASAISTVVDNLTNGTLYLFALEAQNNAGQKSARTDTVAATPQGALLTPIIATLSITGYGTSTQVRQGASGIEVVLSGQRLDTITTAKLLGAFDFTITEKSATSAKLTAIVPHGLEIGPRTLLVSGPSGEAAMADAIEITKITAAKTPQLNPSDTSGLGTPNRPYLTLKRALADAAGGDTILLGAGTYSAGENWPQSSTGNLTLPSPNIPSGITIEGLSSDKGAVLLQGAGKTASSSGLVFAGNATVRNLTLRDFRFALVINAGTAGARVGELELDNLAAIESLVGLTARYAVRVNISRASFFNNNNGGLEATAVGQLGISQSEFSGNTFGIAAGNDSVAGTLLNSSITLNQVKADQNTQFGFSLGNISIDLSNTSAKLNATYGLRILGKPSFVALRSGTSFEQNGDFQLFDARDASPVQIFATRFLLPGSNVVVGQVIGPAESGKFYKITSTNNIINFQ